MKWCLSLLFLFSVSCFAASMSGPRKILSIGCHNTDPICYITIEGSPVGPAGCNGTSIRWDSSTIPGKNHLSLFMAAYHAGKPVDLSILDACFPIQPNFPTFGFSNM
jgi:hypothetical protein